MSTISTEKALFINGVFENVMVEILKSQESQPKGISYLQPYSASKIKLLQKENPSLEEPIQLYLSTSQALGLVKYTAEIVNWENKHELAKSREEFVETQLNKYQPGEGGLYKYTDAGKPCVNLISIRNLKKLQVPFLVSELIKLSDNSPYKERTQSGGWSYVKPLPALILSNAEFKSNLEKELQKLVKESLQDDQSKRLERLNRATNIPEKISQVSSGFKRNPDVVAEVLFRANGICELCHQPAPFKRASDGSPYLEVHHWVTLANGGEDTVDNAAALCPNCHKKAHFGII